MVAAFGSGAMFSLVSGMGGPNNATNAITSGLFFALVQGGLFKVKILVKIHLSFQQNHTLHSVYFFSHASCEYGLKKLSI